MCARLQEDFGANDKYITKYTSVFQKALIGNALDIFSKARSMYVFCFDY